eukprot:9479593-Ditylum_brightwellii.AAC.3
MEGYPHPTKTILSGMVGSYTEILKQQVMPKSYLQQTYTTKYNHAPPTCPNKRVMVDNNFKEYNQNMDQIVENNLMPATPMMNNTQMTTEERKADCKEQEK